jgi:hypothetical protein
MTDDGYSAGMNLSRGKWGGGGVIRGKERKGRQVPSIHNPKTETLQVVAIPDEYNRTMAERFLQVEKLRDSRIRYQQDKHGRLPKPPVLALFKITAKDEEKYILHGARPFPPGHPVKDFRLAFRPSQTQQLSLDTKYGKRKTRTPK